ncbi:MAG TPA: heavy metal translocating P-type ATPase metal-binding domain-containing protein [Chitinophaga sp.]|uniref:heavy metal translocating P-type ATPase n=1 Tax=Chitinophaga sp. TaxID=1869181 RepID=UPI002DB70A3D|nr:heavy metal translocating P-type ATPase metal-binding domain-containing protein [Chitinophaga sp.]HEU4553717.1 heavy metal translocating P-type ATPase metal-binding domain-containing protein [Chitinophaga sp.]
MTTVETCCYHCGEACENNERWLDDKPFCCEGCKLVFELLNNNGLCAYYQLNGQPGAPQRTPVRADKFAFLEDEKIQQQLIQFRNNTHTHVTFYIPQIHCSSCLWLLEHLHRLDAGVQRVTVNFARKEAQVIFQEPQTSLRKVAELLTSIGYEPYISLQDLQHKKPGINRQLIYQLGVAGFCFGNIMLLSFPEYFSGNGDIDTHLFRYLNLALSLPVFLYSAQAFYRSAWGGLKHGFMNIDVPIVLAIFVTFARSLADIATGSGAGYFDALTGIVFFMLAGRALQDKTYQGLSFDRDYTSYFPIAVTVVKGGKQLPIALPDIREGDILLIHNNELVPADGMLIQGNALIDYSFVTGEADPVPCQAGDIIYAGGRQLDGNIQLHTIKPVAQSYLTSLWNRQELQQQTHRETSFIHLLGRYFTWGVLGIAVLTAAWWAWHDPARIWPSVTAILIIACPCALLLASSFTGGHILRILSRHRLYLRNANAIERLAATDHIVFDKTGTLTDKHNTTVIFNGPPLTHAESMLAAALAAQSTHPLSQAVRSFCGNSGLPVQQFRQVTGMGIAGVVNGEHIRLGNAAFTGAGENTAGGSVVHFSVNGQVRGYFSMQNGYRKGIPGLLMQLRKKYALTVLSGDNAREEKQLRKLMGNDAALCFSQQPQDKLDHILALQKQGYKVLMIGDGLNDAGALKQSNTGISLTEDSNNFTPASDGILEARQLPLLPFYIQLCKACKRIILTSFVFSLVYNFTGLFFAVQGRLSPLTAAVLMPASSISIILITWGLSMLAGKRLHRKALQLGADEDQPFT